MKCLENQCKHCYEKTYLSKLYICGLFDFSFLKENGAECKIDTELARTRNKLSKLEEENYYLTTLCDNTQ